MSGQTLNDRLTAARHALAGQGLARIVCKATTEEVIGPKKKHLDLCCHVGNVFMLIVGHLARVLLLWFD
ncbi:phosphatidylinositol-binding clathrin assembly protein LAP [Caerostris extrusa]|uniref:Phosphatidylinositol-binding clathrin assembly protein LAP n=1 Tax=Caerostris extrusa TaxID=172846 RepID=A0AAV4W8X1_CAEEX|nr:phosphatidylinositol-binding clathrin assembly protein LAP [Caerostris extrusa]